MEIDKSASSLHFCRFAQCMAPHHPEPDPRRLIFQLIPWNGKPLNTAELARRFNVSRPTIAARLDTLQSLGLLRLLPFLGNGGKPLLYLRIATGGGLAAFQGFCVDAVISSIQELEPGSRFYWWKTGRVRQIDLVATVGEHNTGFCFSPSCLPRAGDWRLLRIGLQRGLIHHGYFLYEGAHAFVVAGKLQALPLRPFLEELHAWLTERLEPSVAQEARWRINAGASASSWFARRSPCSSGRGSRLTAAPPQSKL
jgi:hypothetical protein